MSIEAIGLIKKDLDALGINYEFGIWSKDPEYPYFVGEYNESEPTTEDGLEEEMFILNGFTRGKYLELEEAKEKIKQHYKDADATMFESGSAVLILYSDSHPIRTDNKELKRIQINLKIKEWKV